ncbi:MAG: hypothetical protein HYS13_07165 [Planctomycetia bacterium]|nr:hypothetical protein [Planctomycetia bacterium]
MPIAVICPGCKASFRVSDRFAGKTGPCPKCKTPIQIPEAAKDEVVIHAPDVGPKDSKGRAITRPLGRPIERIPLQVKVALGAGIPLALVSAWILGKTALLQDAVVAVIALVVVSPPIVWVAYRLQRGDDFNAFYGKALLLRTVICAVAYAGLWVGFHLIPPEFLVDVVGTSSKEPPPLSMWKWMLIVPPFVIAGSLIALGCFDLDFGQGFLHFACYLLMTGVLIWAANMPLYPQVKVEPKKVTPSQAAPAPSAAALSGATWR